MQRKRSELKPIPGCKDCTKDCKWRGSKADPARIDYMGQSKHGCNNNNK